MSLAPILEDTFEDALVENHLEQALKADQTSDRQGQTTGEASGRRLTLTVTSDNGESTPVNSSPQASSAPEVLKRRSLARKPSHQGLSEEQKAEFKELFAMVDKDGGGSIDKDELRKLLVTIKVFPTADELDLIFGQIDDSDDGDIQYEEFVAFMSGGVIRSFDPEELRRAFQTFALPSDPEGSISLSQIRKAFFRHLPDKFKTVGHLDDLLKYLTVDTNGRLNYETYAQSMLAASSLQ